MKSKDKLLILPALELVIDRYPITVNPDMLLANVMAMMVQGESDRHSNNPKIEAVLITEELNIVGIFTARDVVKVIASGQELATTKIAAVMNKEVPILKQSECENIGKVLAMLSKCQLSYLPVVDEVERLVGVITASNICQALQPLPEEVTDIEVVNTQLAKEVERAEERLKLYEQAIAASPSGIVICDARLPDCPIIDANPAFERITGYSAKEIIGKNCRLLQGKNQKQPEIDILRSAIQAGIECNVILQNYRKDDTPFWNDLNITPIYDRYGNLTHYIGIQTDITARKQAEEALAQAQEQLRAVLDGVPGLVSWISSDLRYIGVNKQLAASFNYPPEAFVGQEVGFLECSPRFKDMMRQFFASPAKEFSQEIPTAVDGGSRSYLIVAQKYDRDRAAFSVGIDITNRIRVEEALRSTMSRLTTLIKNLQAGILVKDESRRVVLINETFCKMFGLVDSPHNLIGVDFSNFVNQNKNIFANPQQFLQCTNEILQAKEIVTNEELHLKDGRIFERDFVPILVEENYRGHFWMYRDITARKQAEIALLCTQNELRQALAKEKELSDLKSRFVSMTSHEFRTPLSTILSSAELLEHYRHQWTEEKQLKHLHRIQGSVKHMTHLLNDVLVIGKAESGQFNFKCTPINLVEFCQTLVEEIQLSEEIKHQIIFTNETELKIAFFDERILRQILNNLLSNAIKYSPNSNKVRLRLKGSNGWIVFQVQDYGIGISLEDRHRLFESFHRGANVGNIPGTGLGLAIVKKCVDFCEGKISVDSEIEVGTTFTITLPLNLKC